MSNVWTLLIADDCAEDREVYREYLLSDPHQSYQILEAASAELGLALCQKKHCDAILLDFRLPDMSGLEFLDELKQQQLAVPLPVIMLTGQGDEHIAVQAMKRGAQDYLVKQHLQPHVLQLTVRNAIQQSHLQNQFSKIQKRQQLAAEVALRIRQSLNLEQILQTAVKEIQQLLECDRVCVYQINTNPDDNKNSAAAKLDLTKLSEAGSSSSADAIELFTSFLTDNYQPCFGEVERVTTLVKAKASIIVSRNRKKTQQAYLLVPILLNDREESAIIWGLLVAHQDSNQRQWRTDEVEIFNQLAEQLAIAIQQSQQLSQALMISETEKKLNAFKSQILSTVSHEYRTPLASILMAASTLKQHGDKLDRVKHQQFLQLVEDKARHMAQLVDDLLVIEKLELGKAKFRPLPFELLQFFSDIIEQQRQTLSDRQELTFKITGNTKGFWGDRQLLRQILVNLLSNAIKYSPNGGNVEVHLMGNDSQIIFNVIDEGIGIPIEDKDRLFQLFSRGSNVGNIAGMGLGLAIVKACVQMHGGKVSLESQQHQGTKVTVCLPKRLS
ncbi:MAG: ATP-binding protein [Fischerella sp.]|nr:ATP-binding protein [Fischerella sp.]